MSEKDVKAILHADAKLREGEARMQAKLEETSWSDRETLEEFNMMFGENHEKTREYQEAMNRQHLRNLQNDPVLMQELKAQGMTVLEYAAKMNEDPDAFPEIYREGVRKIVKRAKTGKQVTDSFFDAGRMAKPHPDNIKKAKAIAKKGKGDDKMLADIIDALL